MRKEGSRVVTRVVGFVLCSALIGVAGAISYYNPFTVITLKHVGDRQVDADLEYYMLFLIPIGEDHLEGVKEVVLHHHSRSQSSLELKTATGSVYLGSGYQNESAINEFISDRSRSTHTVWAASHLIFVVFLGGIGALFLTIAVIGESVRLLRGLNVIPSSSEPGFDDPSPAPEGSLPEAIADAMRGSVELTKVLVWRPGELVHVQRPSCGIPVMLFLFCFGGILGAVVGLSCGGMTGGALGAAVGGAALIVFLLAKLPSRELKIDWRGGDVWWREGIRRRSRGMRDLSSVRLGPVHESRRRSRSDEPVSRYTSRLDLDFGGETAPVMDTDQWRDDAAAATRALRPLGEQLARELNVPLKDEPPVEQLSFWGELKRRPLSIPGFLVGLAACVVVAGGLWIGRGIMERRAAESVVEELGGSVVTSSSSVSNVRILENATKIEFDRPIGDEQLAELAPVLPRFRKLKLGLYESSVTDSGLRHLVGLKHIKSLDLGRTSITSRGLEQVAKLTSLVELNLTGCRIDDEGVGHLARLPVLRVLHVSHTGMSDAGLSKLAEVKSLDYLSVGFGSVTKEGVERLRRQLPHTEIRAIGPEFDD